MIFRTFASLQIAVGLSFCLLAGAEESVLETLVVTGTRLAAPLADEASSTQLVTEAELRLLNATHINEALSRVAGTWISRGNGQEHLTAIRSPVLTGAGGCGGFLLAQDGIPLRAAGFCNVNELIESQSENASRIEVMKGPGTALQGSNAMHGMINIISGGFPERRFGRLSSEAGPHDYGRIKASGGNSRLRMDLSATTDGGWKEASGFDQQKASLQWRSRLLDYDLTLRMSYTNLNQETAGFIQGDAAYKVGSLRRSNPNPEAFRDLRSTRIAAHMIREHNNWRTSITPYLRHTSMDFLQHFLPGRPLEKNAHSSAGIQTLWQRDLPRQTGQHRLAVGFDLEATHGKLEETQEGPTMGSPFLVAVIPSGKHYDYEVRARLVAAFLRGSLQISPTTRLTLGLRLEQMHYDYDNRTLNGRTRSDGTECGFGGCRFSRPADRSDTFNNFSPKLGLIQEVGKGQVYARLAQGYRAPQATELYRLQNDQTVPGIDSESIRAVEFGWRREVGDIWFDMGAYDMKKNNVIFRDSNRNNVDNGKTRHQGVEFSLIWRPNPTLDLAVSGTIARHTYDDERILGGVNIDGKDIDTAPRELANLRIGWNFREDARAELEWVHLGDYATDPQNSHHYPGHNLLNLRVSVGITEGISLFGRIINLTDTEYAERADFAFGNERYFVGEPRSVYLGIRIVW